MKNKDSLKRGFNWRYAGGFNLYNRNTGELKSINKFPDLVVSMVFNYII